MRILASRTAKGTAIVNLLNLDQNEKVTATMAIREFNEDYNLLTATKNGIIKKTYLQEYDTNRRDGLIALTLDEDDELIGVRLTRGDDDIILATRKGLAIRFSEKDVRNMGRTARGVKGITLASDDYVISLDVIDNKADDIDLLTMTEHGFAKRSNVSEFRTQGRAGKGVICHRLNPKTGHLVGIKVVTDTDELMVITDDGIVIRQEVNGISVQGRAAQGVLAMKTGESKVVAIAKYVGKDEE